jgi:c-di-GMP-binding flagellar brake protein YcgR
MPEPGRKVVPANRSRTQRWRQCLKQIHERRGAIEIAVSRDYADPEAGRHLVWRVRLLDLRDRELIVEQPMTLGQAIPVNKGIELVGILSIGQNRWMFSTTNLGTTEVPTAGRPVQALRLLMPDTVERCQRRNHYRVETAALSLPEVDVWPLLDPKSVVLAERASELQFEKDQSEDAMRFPSSEPALDLEDVMPKVGPKFKGTLVNLGGGGVGLRVSHDNAAALSRQKLFWMRLCLAPDLRTPICATAKLVHTHMEASQDTYAGLAFEFTFNPNHQRFVVDQIRHYLQMQQQAQLAAEGEQRKRAS